MLSIKQLSKSFGDNEVLKDVNLEVNSGEVVCIIGPLDQERAHYYAVLIY